METSNDSLRRHLNYGTRECQCASCGLYFSSPTTFDKHRAGSIDQRRCLTVQEMRATGLTKDEKGRWSLAS